MRAVCAIVVIAPRSDLPTLSTTMVLPISCARSRQLKKARAVFQAFHQHGNDFGRFVFEKEFRKITEVQIHLVAVADHDS